MKDELILMYDNVNNVESELILLLLLLISKE